MPGSDDGNGRTAQQRGIAAHPEDGRRIVDFLEPLRVLRAREADDGGSLRHHTHPLGFGGGTGLAVEDELRGGGRKPQPFEVGKEKIWLADLSPLIASRIRLGPRPGESARASQASRSSPTE